jgi:hypothetical protein
MSIEIIQGSAALLKSVKEYKAQKYEDAIVSLLSARVHYETAQSQGSSANSAKISADLEIVTKNLSLAYNSLGVKHHQAKEHEAAIKVFTLSNNEKNNFDANYNLGLAHENNNAWDNATEAFENSLKLLSPNDIKQAIEVRCKIIECTLRQKDLNASHTALKEACAFVNQHKDNKDNLPPKKVNFILEQYGKSCISFKVEDSKEIEKIKTLYQQFNPGKLLWSALLEDIAAQYTEKSHGKTAEERKPLVDGLLKQCGHLVKNDKDGGAFKPLQELAAGLALQIGDHQKVSDIAKASLADDLAPILGVTQDSQ